MSDWFSNLKDLAGEHPEAAKASAPPVAKTRRSPREGAGSLDLGDFILDIVGERQEGEALVEGPLRAAVGWKRRIELRLPDELVRFLYHNTRGSINTTVGAMLVFACQELQRSGQKLVLTQAGTVEVVSDDTTTAET